jgi:hypothetical protein
MTTGARTFVSGAVAGLVWAAAGTAGAQQPPEQEPGATGRSAEWEDAPPETAPPEPTGTPANRQPPEPAQLGRPSEPAPPPAFEPAPPYEPPPPPAPKHVAPAYALWVGARSGGWLPFGTMWARCSAVYGGACTAAQPLDFSDYSGAGALFEIDVGARLSRHYNVFVLWEHAALAGASVAPTFLATYQPNHNPASAGARTDYYAIGTRFSSNPDQVGFLAEVALGFRRMSVDWHDGTTLRLSNAPFEFRLGLGADLRLSRLLAISPMFTVGTGVFGDAEWSYPDGSRASGMGGVNLHAAHGWVALQVGGHFDFGR